MDQGASIRPIRHEDDRAVARIIRTVMTELGAAGPGFSIHDPEVDSMTDAYAGERARFYVVERGGVVVGGAGVAPLDGGSADTCELKKMYVLPQARGAGHGLALLSRCLEAARRRGFSVCYVETLSTMTAARRLYEGAGFTRIDGPMGCTGHHGCDRYYTLAL